MHFGVGEINPGVLHGPFFTQIHYPLCPGACLVLIQEGCIATSVTDQQNATAITEMKDLIFWEVTNQNFYRAVSGS